METETKQQLAWAGAPTAALFGQPSWPRSAAAAVSLTYDDALPCHLTHVAPLLECLELRGTFNVAISRPNFLQRVDGWQEIAQRGHELGNHTLFHPCRFEPPYPPNKDPGYNLSHYTRRRFRDEIELANWILTRIDGRQHRTYANPCHHTALGSGDDREPLEPILRDIFLAARGARTDRPVDFAHFDPHNLGTASADERTFADLRREIEAAVSRGQWIIYTIHGVGAGSHRLSIDADAHRQLVEWLGANRARIWTAPMAEVAWHLAEPNRERAA